MSRQAYEDALIRGAYHNGPRHGREILVHGTFVREPGYTVKATNFFVQAANARASMLALLKRLLCECGAFGNHDNCPLD